MAKMGRKPIEFNWDRLASLCQRDMPLTDCAEIMQCNASTIERRIKQKFGKMTFAEFKQQKMATTRLMIKETALDHVKKGNIAMCIFLLKNWCGFSDKVENTLKEMPKPFVIEYINGEKDILGHKVG